MSNRYKEKSSKRKRYPKMSATKGILKGDSCRKTPLKTRGCKDTRFHKTDPNGFAAYELEVYKINKTEITTYDKTITI